MKLILTLILLTSSILALDFDKTVTRGIIKAYQSGKPYGWENTLALISKLESNGGQWMVNLQDPSCGPFHANINTVMRRHPEVEDTNFNRNRLCAKLITDIDFAASEAAKELDFWNKYHKGNYRKVLASYNGGIKGNLDYTEKAMALKPYIKELLNRYKL